MAAAFLELFQLGGCRFLLMKLLPFVVGHAVDQLARGRVAERHALLLGGRPIPFGQAIPAETGQIHQVEILDVGALAQMRDQAPEGSGLKLDSRLVIHPTAPCGAILHHVSPRAADQTPPALTAPPPESTGAPVTALRPSRRSGGRPPGRAPPGGRARPPALHRTRGAGGRGWYRAEENRRRPRQ